MLPDLMQLTELETPDGEGGAAAKIHQHLVGGGQ